MGLFLLLALGFLFAIPLACQKTYSLAPLPGPTSTPTVTATATCMGIPQSTPSGSGIDWAAGGVAEGSNYGGAPYFYGELYLAVNGVAVTNAGVTLTGNGMSPLPLVYNGPVTQGGAVYSDYLSTQLPGVLASGVTYTLTTTTSAGTAYASLTMPDLGSLAADGSAATFTGPAMNTSVQVYNSSFSLTYLSGNCGQISSPFLVPNSAYPTPGNYLFALERANYTANITGGGGLCEFYNLNQIYVTK